MAGMGLPLTRFARIAGLLLVLVSAQPVWARDVFVMLSGGDSQMDNNYSQYLQARAVSAYFEKTYPRDSVWLFFGAGNVEGAKPVISDVYRRIERDGVTIDTWLPGSLPRNRPARRDVILRTFREEILPAIAGGGTLYLFVGDHGSQTRGENPESIISLWGMYPDENSEHGWGHNDDETLGVAEFGALLSAGIGKGRVVFCMTQCHSGGFNYMAVPREMAPNERWFTKVPDWVRRTIRPVTLRAAGFTATDELSLAAGCDPSPDPDKWAGYERFIPELLLGVNMFTLERTKTGLRSFAEAHEAATLVDQTIDKPYSTSEQYLERWATLIETRLAKEPNLTSRVKKSVAAYQLAMDGAASKVSDAEFRKRQEQFRNFTVRLTEQNPAVKSLLLTGTRAQLEEAISPMRMTLGTTTRRPGQRQGGRRGGGGTAGAERRRLWTETVRPAWKEAIEANEMVPVPAAALVFEKYLLKQEDGGRNFFTAAGPMIREEVFWQAGHGNPQTVDTARAEAMARWAVERRAKIIEWARACEDEEVQAAGERLGPTGTAARANVDELEQSVSRQTAAARVLFYRRALAAWEFLISVNERPALARFRELAELERTPLPAPVVALKR